MSRIDQDRLNLAICQAAWECSGFGSLARYGLNSSLGSRLKQWARDGLTPKQAGAVRAYYFVPPPDPPGEVTFMVTYADEDSRKMRAKLNGDYKRNTRGVFE